MTPRTHPILDAKVDAKTELQKKFQWVEEKRRPMLCLPSGVSDALGGPLLKELLPGLLSMQVDIVILGKGPAQYGEYLMKIASENSHRMAILQNGDDAKDAMCKAADMALFLSESVPGEDIELCLKYGTVPVCHASLGLKNYNPNQENGEGFTFEKESVWHCFASVVRALETYRFPFDWKTVQEHCIERSQQ